MTKQDNKVRHNFKIWSHKYDFSEINKNNARQIYLKYLKLTTKKITLLAMLLVLNIISAVISQYVLIALPVMQFLTVSITIWTIILCLMSLGFFYTFIFLEITVWFRMFLGNDLTAVISFNLSDLTFLIFLTLFVFLINYIRVRAMNVKNKRRGLFITYLVAGILASLITAAIDVVYNNGFLIDMYYSNSSAPADKKPLLIAIFWFNIMQYSINLFIFLAIFNIFYFLIDKYE